jgi:hypothetical protein
MDVIIMLLAEGAAHEEALKVTIRIRHDCVKTALGLY